LKDTAKFSVELLPYLTMQESPDAEIGSINSADGDQRHAGS